jgi:hypothetical protein
MLQAKQKQWRTCHTAAYSAILKVALMFQMVLVTCKAGKMWVGLDLLARVPKGAKETSPIEAFRRYATVCYNLLYTRRSRNLGLHA